jgi:tetratricopeptide (TPR) repeat protein/transcriptional regulator with XRE-family HTH domain
VGTGQATSAARTLAELLRRHRLASGLSQEELAEKSGLSVRAIGNLESGRTRRPHRGSVRAIADALALTQAQREQLDKASRQLADVSLADTGPLGTGNADQQPQPAGSPAALIPRHLPAGVPHFAGRAGEFSALTAMADEAAARTSGVVIAVIGGTAGVGKTSLAVHFGHQVTGRFPAGQLYLNLRGFGPSDPLTPAAALREFLDALQVPATQIPATIDGQQGLYRSLLAGRRMLIVLDNARDAEQVRPLLPGSAGCMVVVTSRNELTGLAAANGARRLTLAVFTDTEADELLTRQIGAGRVRSEPAAAQELTELCARLPLALTIAAAQAGSRPRFTLADLATELRDGRSRLDALATGELATDVRAVFSWSYRGLEARAARLFRLLGLHPGPDITAAAAASLAEVSIGEARQLLRDLTRVFLLTEPVSGRYALHDLLRVYAAEKAQAEDGEPECHAANRRMLDHYLHTCYDAARLLQPQRGMLELSPAQAGVLPEQLADHGQALAWLRAEHHVLVAATTLAAETGNDAVAWQLSWSLATFLDWQGHWDDWAATQRVGLAAVVRQDNKPAQAIVRRAYAAACMRVGDYDEAYTHLTECLALCAQTGDRAAQSRIHRDLGNLFEYQDQWEEALRYVEFALRLSREADDEPGQAAALTNLASYQGHLGQNQRARESGQQALELHRALGARYGEAHTLDTLGFINWQLGNLDEAAACHQDARVLFRELGDRMFEAISLDHLGDIRHVSGDPLTARESWQEALVILDDLRHPDAAQIRAKIRNVDAAI